VAALISGGVTSSNKLFSSAPCSGAQAHHSAIKTAMAINNALLVQSSTAASQRQRGEREREREIEIEREEGEVGLYLVFVAPAPKFMSTEL